MLWSLDVYFGKDTAFLLENTRANFMFNPPVALLDCITSMTIQIKKSHVKKFPILTFFVSQQVSLCESNALTRTWKTTCLQSDYVYKFTSWKRHPDGRICWMFHARCLTSSMFVITGITAREMAHMFILRQVRWQIAMWLMMRTLTVIWFEVCLTNRTSRISFTAEDGCARWMCAVSISDPKLRQITSAIRRVCPNTGCGGVLPVVWL